MPAKTKEYLLFTNGSLVQTAADVYMTQGVEEAIRIPAGTVGLILERDTDRSSTPLRVQFLHGYTWWVRPDELKPYMR
tara:strand:+ start:3173 stop:3406 length:234 start_codon:yes stop_codon:yes gene_type:complete